MAKSHYETLGLPSGCNREELRATYRRLVLVHHPDRSTDPNSPEIFLSITRAYEVLSDPERKRQYDEILRLERLKAEQDRLRSMAENRRTSKGTFRNIADTQAPPTVQVKVQAPDNFKVREAGNASLTVDVTRLTMMYTRGQFIEAERLARKIIDNDGRQPIPYAVLGDLHRQRGELPQAAKMYAFAVQMDPNNSLYQQRYEELIGATQVREGQRTRTGTPAGQLLAPAFGGVMVLVLGMYLVLSNEPAIMPGFQLLSTWTFGLVVMQFLAGVVIGTTFSIGHLFDRFSTVTVTTVGGLSPAVALAFVAVANFWAALLIYLGIGFLQDGFNFSTSRLVTATAFATILFAIMAALSNNLSAVQTLFWGGNLIYLGGLIGWMVADSFRK